MGDDQSGSHHDPPHVKLPYFCRRWLASSGSEEENDGPMAALTGMKMGAFS